ncbi:c-type cytochrome [Effusibacillus lacus]|uniref:Cytochrome c551 n=1 Tax=Effusibacillus lacus TaxID=1348429 RepID=A0A292YQT8_9BACL|nr:cytochrome c [Effusibacillus lacus]TCS74151.1 cytochrome c551 [Effusibacillus lacus]GAX90850.1 cytochrome c551 [Effusibacillus lacus]
MNKTKWLIAAALGIALIATGCSSGGDTKGGNTGTATPPAASDIPAAYTKNCASCHGKGLEGTGSFPKLTNVGGKLSQDQIKTKIQQGGNGMPAFEKMLSADEINSLSSWLAAKK